MEERTAELTKANERLQREIADRARAEEQVQASLREKEVLLQEIHHRVKNNLTIISSLLSLQAEDLHDPQALRAFRRGPSSAASMPPSAKTSETASGLSFRCGGRTFGPS